MRKLSYHCIILFSLVSFPELRSHFVISVYLSVIHIFIPSDPDSSHQRLFFSERHEAKAKEHNVLELTSTLTISTSSAGAEELR